MADKVDAALEKLREPFPDHQISKLPKPTKAQTDEVKANFKAGVRCKICGGWHHPQVVHLDYVGHAALTDRLLNADLAWNWEPVAFNQDGLPAFDQSGGLWIRLTVEGVSRLGYGHAAPKPGGDLGNREKEVIGDALRNAAMRFGAALDLWHKGDLHLEDEPDRSEKPPAQQEPVDSFAFPPGPAKGITELKSLARALWREIEGCGDETEMGPLLDVTENAALMKQMAALENPAHLEIWLGDGKDNPGLAGLITRKQTEFAQRKADLMGAG